MFLSILPKDVYMEDIISDMHLIYHALRKHLKILSRYYKQDFKIITMLIIFYYNTFIHVFLLHFLETNRKDQRPELIVCNQLLYMIAFW